MSMENSLLAKLMDFIVEEMQCLRMAVILVDEAEQIIFQALRGNGYRFQEAIHKDVIKKTLAQRQPVITQISQDFAHKGDHRDSQRSVICLPLIMREKLSGILYIDREASSGVFTQEDLELLVTLSNPIRWILKKSQEFQSLQVSHIKAPKSFVGGKSGVFQRIFALIDRVKDNDIPVFICGESGTGKELVARTIHTCGARNKGKFIAVNCGAIPEHLLESELFGYVRGAFTGAIRTKPGLIEEAEGGTFFLDEICDLPLTLQAKLLRLLQEKEIRRIGENTPLYVNSRFISATNKNIEREIEHGNFREDLYYRLKIITLELPPLRKRKEDLYFLLNYFLEKYSLEMKREQAYFAPSALELLIDYSWPGNVRELQNEIQSCLILAGESPLIKEEYLSSKINPQSGISSGSPYNFFQARAAFEKRFLHQALARWNFNRTRTAEEVGLSRQGLFKLMKKHRMRAVKKKCTGVPRSATS